MRWPEHQRAMLREMGIPAFWPEEGAPSEAPVVADAHAPKAQVVADELSQPKPSASSAQPTPPALRVAPAPVVAAKGVHGIQGTKDKPKDPAAGLGPLPEGIAAMDWPALHAAVAGCQACALCHSRTQAVLGVGPAQADWMIVGGAPDEQEDQTGEPFAGRAGTLLDRMLHAVQLTRAPQASSGRVYVTHVLKCRPPANRTPQAQEAAQCEPYLLRQIALVQPKVILVMGRFAVRALLKSNEPIGKLRGRAHSVAGVPVLASYHPDELLRNPLDKAQAWDDLCLARELVRTRDAAS